MILTSSLVGQCRECPLPLALPGSANKLQQSILLFVFFSLSLSINSIIVAEGIRVLKTLEDSKPSVGKFNL
ncbi:hypothetical protein HZ326_11644 [Fusarium oxysporum f. sp. albedinis]|nr:hypothetical protein HZ326_11644 [Fusarium oxysporum f. sp. albedinis]